MKVKYFAYYRHDTGCKEEEFLLPPLSVMELLRHIGTKYGKSLADRLMTKERDNINPDVIFLVNGRNIDFLDDIDTIIKEDDLVSLFPRIAGG